jgi:hypothetical protein
MLNFLYNLIIEIIYILMENNLKCMKPGCGKQYTEAENNETACRYHSGKPIFHDIKKGWTCCNKLVYDWDEFTKLEGCEVSSHSNIKQDAEFFKSQTVNNAQKGIDKSEQVKIKSINDHEKEQKAKEEEKKKLEQDKPKEIIVNIHKFRKIKMVYTFAEIPAVFQRPTTLAITKKDSVSIMQVIQFSMIGKNFGLVVNKRLMIGTIL